NYYVYSIVEGKIDLGGTSPWWDYFRRIWTESWPVLAPIYFFGMIGAWVRFPRNLFTWCYAPLLLFNILIPHKETRFLFPMAHAAPLLLVMALQSKNKLWKKPWRRLLVGILGALNVVALLILMFVPASMPTRFYDYVYHQEISEIYFMGRDPYVQLGIPLYFYRPEGLVTKRAESVDALKRMMEDGLLLFHTSRTLPSPELQKICTPEFSIYPEWLRSWNPGGFMRNANDWSLFSCRREG
ncbi:MAG: hypothetical protein AABZ55_01085, partial [Bdellovibrionota bacterium]